jgi:hypothetical protein
MAARRLRAYRSKSASAGALPSLCPPGSSPSARRSIAMLAGRRDEVVVAVVLRTVSDGSASMTNLFCLRS